MRRTRRLFLLAIVAILAGVGVSYHLQQKITAARPRIVPKALRANVQAAGQDWVYRKEEGGRPIVELRARDMERVEEESARILLKGVELRLFHKGGSEFDLVKSSSAVFREAEGSLFSDGGLQITLGVPAGAEPSGRLLGIRTSGVWFDSATGRARTDKPASFTFDLGSGEAVGATYDPSTRDLQLLSDVKLQWRGRGENTTPMHLEAGGLLYREHESKVYLSSWSRLTRERLTLNAADSVVTLEQGNIRTVDAQKAEGADEYPGRRLRFGAQELHLDLTARSEIEKITGAGQSWLEATTDAGDTMVRADRVTMDFEIRDKASILTRTLVQGSSRLESRPAVRSGQPPRATRILKTEVAEIKMRPDGEQIEQMETHTPGDLDLIPHRPTDPRRQMSAERMWLRYGGKNQLQSFRAVQVATRTLKPAAKGKPEPRPALTWSKDMTAAFDPETGDVTRIEQWNEFRYREGEQEATAAKAILEQAKNLIHLEGDARVWDKSGSVKAAKIVMHQETGDFTAEGNVASSRLPEDKSASGGMLEKDQPVQATAQKMVSTDRNRHIVYEGGAVLWQSANRLQAARVVIDRKEQKLHATGKVVSQLLDKAKPNAPKKDPVLTLVRSEALEYDDQQRIAWYKGQVRLLRENLDVKSRELRAFLNQSKDGSGDSRLDRAFADGDVEILQSEKARTRRGLAEHAEYYVTDERVILHGGYPQMFDSATGNTSRGRKLTYFANNDSLQVDGAPAQPAVNLIRRK